MDGELFFQNIDCQSLDDDVLDFSFDQEFFSQLEFNQTYNEAESIQQEQEPQNFYVWSITSKSLIKDVKQEEELIIEDVIDMIENESIINDDSYFYEKDSKINSTFEKVMKEFEEEEMIIEEEIFFFDSLKKETVQHRCEFCQRAFSKTSYLLQHINYKHTEKPFRCARCHKKFSHEIALENHIMKHKNVNKPFKCHLEGCEKAYAYKADLKIHALNNHVKDVKSHVCECGKGFSRRDHLIKHKNTKTHLKKIMALKR